MTAVASLHFGDHGAVIEGKGDVADITTPMNQIHRQENSVAVQQDSEMPHKQGVTLTLLKDEGSNCKRKQREVEVISEDEVKDEKMIESVRKNTEEKKSKLIKLTGDIAGLQGRLQQANTKLTAKKLELRKGFATKEDLLRQTFDIKETSLRQELKAMDETVKKMQANEKLLSDEIKAKELQLHQQQSALKGQGSLSRP